MKAAKAFPRIAIPKPPDGVIVRGDVILAPEGRGAEPYRPPGMGEQPGHSQSVSPPVAGKPPLRQGFRLSTEYREVVVREQERRVFRLHPVLPTDIVRRLPDGVRPLHPRLVTTAFEPAGFVYHWHPDWDVARDVAMLIPAGRLKPKRDQIGGFDLERFRVIRLPGADTPRVRETMRERLAELNGTLGRPARLVITEGGRVCFYVVAENDHILSQALLFFPQAEAFEGFFDEEGGHGLSA